MLLQLLTTRRIQHTITKFEGPPGSEDEYFLGYHQDTTDIASAHARAGHYESLKRVESEVAPATNDTREETIFNTEVVVAIQTEEKILSILGKNAYVAEGCLSRLYSLSITANDLLQCDICSVLMTHVYPYHLSTVGAGIICRKLLKKFEDICKEVDGYDAEPFNTTICEDVCEEAQPTAPPKKTFRNMFRRKEVSTETLLVDSTDDVEVSVEEFVVTPDDTEIQQNRESIANTTTNFGELLVAESTRLTDVQDFVRQPAAKRKRRNHNFDVDEDDENPRRRRIAEAAARNDSTVVDESPATSEAIALPKKRGRPKKTAPKSSVFEVRLVHLYGQLYNCLQICHVSRVGGWKYDYSCWLDPICSLALQTHVHLCQRMYSPVCVVIR